MRPIHPFPARMAPEIVIEECKSLGASACVLDPMAGSGTVLRVAAESGIAAIGCDSDPLAVLISSVWTTPVNSEDIVPAAKELVARADALTPGECTFSWQEDAETKAFIDFWFANGQRDALTKLSACLQHQAGELTDVLRVCLSRLIITKDAGASLARDVSHSRPHRVRIKNDFDVAGQFIRSAATVARQLDGMPVKRKATVMRGDARNLSAVDSGSVDAVITSPPYLNAIDYMRAHRMSLVWLGYSIPELRAIRSGSMGSEKGPDSGQSTSSVVSKTEEFAWFAKLPSREAGLVRRYAADIHQMMQEVARVLKPRGRAVTVIGNSCLRGVYIENSGILEAAADLVGLRCTNVYARDLPESKRYLPVSSKRAGGDLAKRMRKECVLTFEK